MGTTLEQRLRWKYDLSLEEFDDLLASQGGACAICRSANWEQIGLAGRALVDHDHETGRVRGLLCNSCNSRLGWFEEWMGSIANYLEVYSTLDRVQGFA